MILGYNMYFKSSFNSYSISLIEALCNQIKHVLLFSGAPKCYVVLFYKLGVPVLLIICCYLEHRVYVSHEHLLLLIIVVFYMYTVYTIYSTLFITAKVIS